MRKILLSVLFLLPKIAFADFDLNKIHLPPGFKIAVYADQVPKAREMTLGKNNVVYVGTLEGKVYALMPNPQGDTAKAVAIIDGLKHPHGVAYFHGDLYVSDVNKILRYPEIQGHDRVPEPIIIMDQLPSENWHGLRPINFSPDGWLYAGIGMPCNTCDYRKTNPMLGTLVRMRLDGRDFQIFARGIRNSVGFDWDPKTHVLWFTDNGQDYLGDNLPPDEINRAPQANMDFGFPYVYGNNMPAPGYDHAPMNTQNFTPPVYNLPAHVAPLGLRFYTGSQFPVKYQQQMFIAEHGSWNRSTKIGYQVVLANVEADKISHVEPFAYGWLQGKTVYGRPVDLLTMTDGSLLVSDDYAGKIYRISYSPPAMVK